MDYLTDVFTSLAVQPYPSLPLNFPFSSFHNFFLHPLVPITFAAAYSITVKSVNRRRPSQPRKLPRWFIVAHDVALTAFSFTTFITVAPVVASKFLSGWRAGGANFYFAYCDLDGSLWNAELGRFAYLFYLSKYYEVVDTAILLIKGQKVPLLQEYHHAGAVLAMYASYRYQGTPVWIFVVLNSALHTWMYFYFALSALKVPLPKDFKRRLTMTQIAQFIVGGTIAASYFLPTVPRRSFALDDPSLHSHPNTSVPYDMLSAAEVGASCLTTTGQRFALLLNILFLIPLTKLFLDFYRETYLSDGGSKGHVTTASKSVVLKGD